MESMCMGALEVDTDFWRLAGGVFRLFLRSERFKIRIPVFNTHATLVIRFYGLYHPASGHLHQTTCTRANMDACSYRIIKHWRGKQPTMS